MLNILFLTLERRPQVESKSMENTYVYGNVIMLSKLFLLWLWPRMTAPDNIIYSFFGSPLT